MVSSDLVPAGAEALISILTNQTQHGKVKKVETIPQLSIGIPEITRLICYHVTANKVEFV